MSSSSPLKLEPRKRALAIFGAVAMAPIAGLAVGIFLLSAVPVILLAWTFFLPRGETPRFPPMGRGIAPTQRRLGAHPATAH